MAAFITVNVKSLVHVLIFTLLMLCNSIIYQQVRVSFNRELLNLFRPDGDLINTLVTHQIYPKNAFIPSGAASTKKTALLPCLASSSSGSSFFS
jgi:hypothetical protein